MHLLLILLLLIFIPGDVHAIEVKEVQTQVQKTGTVNSAQTSVAKSNSSSGSDTANQPPASPNPNDPVLKVDAETFELTGIVTSVSGDKFDIGGIAVFLNINIVPTGFMLSDLKTGEKYIVKGSIKDGNRYVREAIIQSATPSPSAAPTGTPLASVQVIKPVDPVSKPQPDADVLSAVNTPSEEKKVEHTNQNRSSQLNVLPTPKPLLAPPANSLYFKKQPSDENPVFRVFSFFRSLWIYDF